MAKAVFTSRIGSGYDDNVETRYHFPRRYLLTIERALGDLIVYYEPRRGDGAMAYFGTAQVAGIRPDPKLGDHYYADLVGYLDFERKVPFAEGGLYYESQLRKDDGTASRGAFGWSVRSIPDHEFEAICVAGRDIPLPWLDPAVESEGFSEREQAAFEPRPIVPYSRPYRDRIFTRSVQRAYDRRCAVTGLRLLNGGGRPEVQAAHIQPVASFGPDSVRNGVALSGTVHWLFDRGLMTFEDDHTIRTVRDAIPEPVARLINPTGKLIVPDAHDLRPSPTFLRFHRENVFKG